MLEETNRGSILVVDDDDAIRDSSSLLLEAEGYDVAALASGDELLDGLERYGHSVILLDIRMPGTNGMKVLETLSEKAPDRAVIMITGHGDVPMAVRALNEGAVDFIEKPFTDARLLDAVARAADAATARRSEADQREKARALLERLTPREAEVMALVVAGQASKVIAGNLDISPRTVEIHRQRIMQKMEARSLSHLVRLAMAADMEINWQ